MGGSMLADERARTRLIAIGPHDVTGDGRSRIRAECHMASSTGQRPTLLVHEDVPIDVLWWTTDLNCAYILVESEENSGKGALHPVIARYRRVGSNLTLMGLSQLESDQPTIPATIWHEPTSHTVLWMVLATIATLFVGAWATVVPAPFLLSQTEPTYSVETIVTAPGATKDSGLRFATYSERQAHWIEVPFQFARSKFVEGKTIQPLDTQSDVRSGESDVKDDSLSNSVLAALTQANTEITDVDGDGVLVKSLNAPGQLDDGDVVIAADDSPVKTTIDLYSVLDRHAAGDKVPVRIEDGSRKTLYLRPNPQYPEGWMIEEQISTKNLRYTSPFPAKLRRTIINGNSSGLAVALWAYIQLTGDDVIRGRRIVVTGNVDASGIVREVGGVPFKALQAQRERAEIMLVPTGGSRQAFLFDGIDDLQVVDIHTLADAIAVLHRGDGRPTGHPQTPRSSSQSPTTPIRGS